MRRRKSRGFIEHGSKTFVCASEDGETVGEEDSRELEAKQSPQRAEHFLAIDAIFRRQQTEPVRLKINQRIADDQRALPAPIVKSELARRGAFERESIESMLAAVFAEVLRVRKISGEFGRNNHALSAGKCSGGTRVIGISEQDCGDVAHCGKFKASLSGERDWINHDDVLAGANRSGKELRFYTRMIGVPESVIS